MVLELITSMASLHLVAMLSFRYLGCAKQDKRSHIHCKTKRTAYFNNISLEVFLVACSLHKLSLSHCPALTKEVLQTISGVIILISLHVRPCKV